MSTIGHESELISVGGLKTALQKFKTDKVDIKADKGTTIVEYGITDAYTKSEIYTKGEVDANINQAKSNIIDNATVDYNTLGKLENKIITEVEDRIDAVSSETSRATIAENGIRTDINNEITRAQEAEEGLRGNIEALSLSNIIVILDHTQIISPETNTIYREQGTNSYSDWMYYDNTWKRMALYDNAIDEQIAVGSKNLVESSGIYDGIEKNTSRHAQDLNIVTGSFWSKSIDGTVIIRNHPELNKVEHIVVEPGSVWKISCSGLADAESYYIVDKNMNYISSSGSSNAFDGEITIPNNGYYLLLNSLYTNNPEAIEKGSVFEKIDNQSVQISSNKKDILKFFEQHSYRIDQVLYNTVHNFIKDIEFSADNEDYLYNVSLLYILNGFVIGTAAYYSINVRFKTRLGAYSDVLFDIHSNRNGVLFYKVTQSGFTMKAVVDWDALTETKYDYNEYFKFKKEYCRKHEGAVYDWERFYRIDEAIDDILSPKETDQMFIHNKEVVCFNNFRNASDIYAKYAKVDLGDVCQKIMCKFKLIGTTNFNVLCLATTARNTNNPIGDITASSVHVTISRDAFVFGLYLNDTWQRTTVELSSALDENTEYEFGYEFLGDDKVKFYLPDGTTDIRVINGVDAVNGRYIIFEQYGFNSSNKITIDFPRVTIKGIYAKPANGIALHDNFVRMNGPLTVAPSGHTYKTFRNNTNGDTIYDN